MIRSHPLDVFPCVGSRHVDLEGLFVWPRRALAWQAFFLVLLRLHIAEMQYSDILVHGFSLNNDRLVVALLVKDPHVGDVILCRRSTVDVDTIWDCSVLIAVDVHHLLLIDAGMKVNRIMLATGKDFTFISHATQLLLNLLRSSWLFYFNNLWYLCG